MHDVEGIYGLRLLVRDTALETAVHIQLKTGRQGGGEVRTETRRMADGVSCDSTALRVIIF